MSRPFSYSDENFTLIGNVLFCHIKLTKPVKSGKPIVEIPPAIYDRMLFNTQTFYQVSKLFGSDSSYAVNVGVLNPKDNKYYLFCKHDIYETGTFLVGFYILTDV